MRLRYISAAIGILTGVITYFVTAEIRNKRKDSLYTLSYTIEASQLESKATIKDIVNIYRKRLIDENEDYDIDIKTINDSVFKIVVKNEEDPDHLNDLIIKSGKLQILNVYTAKEESVIKILVTLTKLLNKNKSEPQKTEPQVPDSISQSVRDLLKDSEVPFNEDSLSNELLTFYSALQSNSFIGFVNEDDTGKLRRLLQSPEIIQITPPDMQFSFEKNADVLTQYRFKLFALHSPDTSINRISNKDIAGAVSDYRDHKPVISIEFTPKGTVKWAALTKKNIGKCLAITINGQVIIAPMVTDEITNGKTTLEGFSIAESDEIETLLNSPAIPANIRVLDFQKSRQKFPFDIRNMLTALVISIIAFAISAFVFKSLNVSSKQM